MKVLTIREPWASLIINGYKEYEFRSWKTNYRGKILIHTSSIIDKDMLDRFKDYNLDYITGAIIGEAEIVDYILVDAEEEVALAQQYKVMQAPTFVVVDGQDVHKYVNASNIKKYAESREMVTA